MSRTSVFLASLACMFLAFLTIIVPAQPVPAREPPPQQAPIPAPQIPANVTYHEDVIYHTVGKTTLRLDLAYPKQASGPLPTVVLLPGAGPLARGKKVVAPLAIEFARKGYVGVAVGYRHRPEGEFLAPIHDAKAAVRWLRTQVKKHPIDPERIGAVGFSAGASLACLLGMTTPDDGLEEAVGPNLPSSRVQAAAGYYGPSDMKILHAGWTKSTALNWLERTAMQGTVESWIGGPPAKVAERYSRLSPISYVRKDIAPLLLLHGTADRVIPVEQSLELGRRLREKKAPVNVLLFENSPHDFDDRDDINTRLAAAAVLTFLQEHLGKR